jgi:2-isopropylmalate synthase
VLSKIEISHPASPDDWPEAEVELQHGERGTITGKASASGALDAVFSAVSQIMKLPARVDQLELQYVAADPSEPAGDGQAANVLVEISLDIDGEIFAGRARSRDILPCAVAAYIDAASNAEAVHLLRAARAREEAA